MSDRLQQVEEVPEEAWAELRERRPHAVVLADGSVLVGAGKWAIGKREHGYAHLEVAGMDPREAAKRGLAELVLVAEGDEVERVLAEADARWDGEWRVMVRRSYVAVYRVRSGLPVKLRAGHTYYSAHGHPYGSSRTRFYGGPTGPQAYAAAVRRLRVEWAREAQELRRQVAAQDREVRASWVPIAGGV